MVLRPSLVVPLLSCLCVLSACNLDPYHLGFDGDAGSTATDARAPRADSGPIVRFDGGGTTGDGGRVNGDGGACAAEVCDGKDNDCDGVIDNGFDLQNDPNNCGQCGLLCDQAQANQRGRCVAGKCTYECVPGFLDCDASKPGCEYACIKTNNGVEVCDGIDNNCDCQVDEGFNTKTDPQNCGACGHVCVALHAESTCTDGKCGFGACDPGYKDFDPNIPGCEYRCPYFPAKATDTTCDGVDDDCNGKVDDGVAGVGDSCSTGLKGACADGVFACVNGTPACQPKAQPIPELCNGIDDDCDGAIDNGFDKQNDPNHCGDSCTVCSFPHAIAGCSAGKCKYVACDPGWSDRFPDDQFPDHPGCDYQCTPTGPEVCDGIDNDCDGLIDNADPDLIKPPTNFCNQRGACAGATLACSAPKAGCSDTTVAWRCVYPGGTELDSCGDLVAQETQCDGIDGDCDGAVDDAFPNIGQPCDDGQLGICRSSGSFQCDPGDASKKTTKCIITTHGQASRAETCNGLDDDCDGTIDNGVKDNMVHITANGANFWIQQYEASRPDATSTTEGNITDHACANPGVMPWNLVTWTEANTVCAATGKRLCTEPEWQNACGGTTTSTPIIYPYGSTYQPNTCNGNDYDPDCTGSDDDILLATATPMGCPTKPATSACFKDLGGGKVFDMSGNLREWTSSIPAAGLRRIRGGAFDNVGDALSCTFNFWAETESSDYYNLGFRCCADTN